MAPMLPVHNGGNVGRQQHGPNSLIPNRVRNEMIAWTAEFTGTFMFLFLAFGAAQVADAAARAQTAGPDQATTSISQVPNGATLLYISLAAGFSLAASVWMFYRISGGLFNPAVTLGLYLVGAVKLTRAVVCFVAQILGSIAATAVVSAIFPGPLNVSTSLREGMSVARGLFLEMILTSQLVFTVFMLAVEKHKATYLAPIAIGLSLFVAEMTGVYFTGGSLNPARSFGPAVVTGHFDSYHWIYWLGPVLGTLLAYGFYWGMKTFDYKTVTPGQDFNEQENELFQPPEDPETGEEVAAPNVMNQMVAQVATQVVEKVSLGPLQATHSNSSSPPDAGRTLSSAPEVMAFQANTRVGLVSVDGAARRGV